MDIRFFSDLKSGLKNIFFKPKQPSTETATLKTAKELLKITNSKDVYDTQMSRRKILLLKNNDDGTYSAHSVSKKDYNKMSNEQLEGLQKAKDIQEEVAIQWEESGGKGILLKPSNVFQRFFGSNIQQTKTITINAELKGRLDELKKTKKLHPFIVPPFSIHQDPSSGQIEVITVHQRPLDLTQPTAWADLDHNPLRDAFHALKTLHDEGVYFANLTPNNLVESSSSHKSAMLDCIDKIRSEKKSEADVCQEFFNLIPDNIKELESIKKLNLKDIKTFNGIRKIVDVLRSAILSSQITNHPALQ